MDARPPASAWPTLRQLQFLVALQTYGSFVRAAEAVGVTQPTLSAGIKELETVLGAVLVDRGRSGAGLTPAGEEAVARAGRALAEVEAMIRAMSGAGAPLSGPFRLGAIPTIAPFLLPRALPALRHAYPHLRLFLREDQTARLVDALRQRTIDAAVIALPYEAAGLAMETIGDDEFLLAAPAGHPLTRRNDLSPDHLQGEEVLLLEDGHCLREHALSICAMRPGQGRSADVAATSLTTLVQMVAGGLGITLLPRMAVEAGAAAGPEVEIRPFQNPVIGRSIGVAWRADGPREAEARLLAKSLRASLAGKVLTP